MRDPAAVPFGPVEDRVRLTARILGVVWTFLALLRVPALVAESPSTARIVVVAVGVALGLWLLRVRGRLLPYAVDIALAYAVLAIPVQLTLAPAQSTTTYIGFYVCASVIAFGVLPTRRALVVAAAIVLGTAIATLSGALDVRTALPIVVTVAIAGGVVLAIRETLRRTESHLEDAFHNASLPMAFMDPEGRIERVNAALERLSGRPRAELAGRRLGELLSARDPESGEWRLHRPSGEVWVEVDDQPARERRGRDAHRFVQVVDVTDRRRTRQQQAMVGRLRAAALEGGDVGELHERVRSEIRAAFGNDLAERVRFDGERRRVVAAVDGMASTDRDFLAGVAAVFESASVRAEAEARVRHEATHDALTRLPNRVLFGHRVEAALAAAQRDGRSCAVLFLDLDRFKVLNDTLGHAAGDRLLEGVAARLAAAVRPDDTVARLAGDEFGILLAEVASPSVATMVARRVARTIEEPFTIDGSEWVVKASIGVAVSGPQATVDQLLAEADVAMFHAKEGHTAYALFDAELAERTGRRFAIETDLRRAIERDELTLAYQPVFSVDDQPRLKGFEALLRWTRAGGDAVTPAEFIPVAEDTGLIVAIGRWVLRTALEQNARWAAEHGRHTDIFINVSGRQLTHPDMLPSLRDALSATGVPPEVVHLEITESVLLERTEAVLTRLQRLQDTGVHIAIDDFGTGFSSLSYLKRFPVSEIKIDRSFVAGLGCDADDTAIVQAMTSMAAAMGLSVVAEGIETTQQLEFVRRLGCARGQGFLLGRPAGPDAASALMRGAAALVPAG